MMGHKRIDIIGQNGNDGDHYDAFKCNLGRNLITSPTKEDEVVDDPMHRTMPKGKGKKSEGGNHGG